jgi:hypothetical protein
MERLSDAKRGELWDRWEAGESQRSIADTSGLSGTRPVSNGVQRPLHNGTQDGAGSRLCMRVTLGV